MLALSLMAFAYEADTLTGRDDPLPDVTSELDAHIQGLISDAIVWTNGRTRCDQDPEQVRAILARAIHVRTARNELVQGRGGLRAFGFDRVSAWVETGNVERRDFLDRSDIFGSTTGREAPLLKWAGVCSTVRVNGVLVGTDKLDHFFEEGYNGWRRSAEGQDLDAAIDWATHTENTRYGLSTSETFSFGDLRADWDGLHFYDGLLEPGSVAVLGDDGCVRQGKPFTWADWVTWEYDEVLNPPIYTPSTQQGVDRHLWTFRDDYCASYAAWGGQDYQTHLAAVLRSEVAYASGEAPVRYDPYRLDALCDGDADTWLPPTLHEAQHPR